MRIDVDAHVDETDATWEYLSESDKRFKPVTLDPGAATAHGDNRPHRLWMIDGTILLRRWRDDKRTGTVKETRELLDVGKRIRHMDELHVDVQVLYPTMFLHSYTAKPEIELALCKAYNRWIAASTEKSKGRLRWVAMMPYLSMDEAVKEVQWAKDHGACGVFKKGIECDDRAASDPYYFPIYEEAGRLDLPICIHNATSHIQSLTVPGNGIGGGMIAITAFSALAEAGVPDKFPKLRIGFIETGASWIPFLHADLMAKMLRRTFLPIEVKEDLFRKYRIYVACHTNDDLPYILKYGTEDSLMIGTDYSHADQSAEIEALDVIEQRGKTGDISAEVARKIISDNPRRFYAL
ncbi:MAG: amidohydrolase [Deltaproteobacteria bacterium]|nr:amidohydrolase [Deltaproteobacteria bacterium]